MKKKKLGQKTPGKVQTFADGRNPDGLSKTQLSVGSGARVSLTGPGFSENITTGARMPSRFTSDPSVYLLSRTRS